MSSADLKPESKRFTFPANQVVTREIRCLVGQPKKWNYKYNTSNAN